MTVWRGDRGFSDLIDQEEISKDDLCFDVLGTLDEASAVLGLARALATASYGKSLILNIQEDLCWMMSELAAQAPVPATQRITTEHTARIEEQMRAIESEVPRPSTFIAAGDGLAGAAIQLARTVVRRAERLVVKLDHAGRLQNSEILAYLNHLSAYLYSLARYEDVSAGNSSPTLLHPGISRLVEMEESDE